MFNIGPVELMVVLVLALLVFGPAKLPELLGSVGHAIREFQRASRELTDVFQETQQEFQSALDLDEQQRAQTETGSYEVPAEEAAEPIVAEAPVTAQPEEFETAAAMIDPVEPFQPPVEPEPEPEPVVAVAEPPKPKRSRRKKADDAVAEPPATAEPAVAEITSTAPVVADADVAAPATIAAEADASPPATIAGEPEPTAPAAVVADSAVASVDVETGPASAADAQIAAGAAEASEPPIAEPPTPPKRAPRRRAAPAATQGVSAMTPLEEPIAAPTNGSAPHANGTEPKPRRRRSPVAAASAPGDESA